MEGLLFGNLLSKFGLTGNSNGSNIKSIQRGEYEFQQNSTWANVTISQVDISMSIVLISIASDGNSATTNDLLVSAYLINSENIRLSRGGTQVSPGCLVSWQVIEFNNINLQTGFLDWTLATANDNKDVLISHVEVSKTLIIVNYQVYDLSATHLVYGLVKSQIKDSSTITFTAYGNDVRYQIRWQVIEFK